MTKQVLSSMIAGLLVVLIFSSPVSAQSSDEQAVRAYFHDIPVMVKIAKCESTFRHTRPDGSVLRGEINPKDTGIMQINLDAHGSTARKLGLNLEDREDNMAYARHLYRQQGTNPWRYSRKCWS